MSGWDPERYWREIEAVTGLMEDTDSAIAGKKRVYRGNAIGSVSVNSRKFSRQQEKADRWMQRILESGMEVRDFMLLLSFLDRQTREKILDTSDNQ